MSTRDHQTAEEVTSNSVRNAKVGFRPTAYFEEALGTRKYEKAQDLMVSPGDIPPEDDDTTKAGSQALTTPIRNPSSSR